ncbi:AAA family ATPase [Sphingomonas cavernae]|uniref:Capsular biosynthesis protein n=1 Tax=Sphingomonas cavernae TaxID=2320861 RepID=A0A418WN49_9SPHN|nr:AAA family ATPase [Sphingomonas cavernae]RJF91425.1 capsular biosynthesis protein [Sphingomonas cavernae]
MNKHTPLSANGSLLERASQVFDLRKAVADNVVELPTPAVFVQAAPVTPRTETLPLHTPRAFAGRQGSVDRDALKEAGFILPDMPAGLLGEEFRLVKRQLLIDAKANPAPKGRMILVASAKPNEGKTFSAINLALSMAAEKDVEVLLVDADFAKPEILATLGLEDGPGLMDALADPTLDVESCIVRTDVAGLYVLPAGQQTNSDTEQLASVHTAAVLETLLTSNPARIVIVDSPPALAASPASVLALHAGQCVMVVKADRTTEAELRDALGLLHGCETIRLLLNAVSYKADSRSFGTYYGYGD